MKISIVIPCYKSTKSLPSVVFEIIKTFRSREIVDYEIILVNDGSSDDTYSTIKELSSKNDKIKGISLAKNFGQASAMIAGYHHVTGDYVVHIDDDGQSPVNNLWKLVDKLEEGFDLVFSQYSKKKNSLMQKIGTGINNWMASYLIDKPKDLYFGNFWICRKFVINEVIKCKNPYPYIAGFFLKTTFNMTGLKMEQRERMHGKTNYTFKKMLSLWLNGFTAFSIKPLRIATGFGFICSITGFIAMTYTIILKIQYPEIPAGYSSVIATILFIGGMLMFMLGMIGEYVGRIYLNINQIPQFVIREKTF